MNLDIIAGALTGWLALCVFTLHVISSPKRRNWMTIPEYVRRGFIVTGAMFAWRSVNFLTVAGSGLMLGHINAEGMMALVALVYTVSALAFWASRGLLPDRAWDRLEHAASVMRDDPAAVPILVSKDEVTDIAHATGQPAVGPNEGPGAVAREGPRMAAMRDRQP